MRLLVPRDQLPAPTVAFIDGDGELPQRMAGPVRTVIEVPTVNVRTLLAGVDLLKLDVEGQEHALLVAAGDHLRAHRPTVLIEVLPGTARLRRLLPRLCIELDYRCYVPQPDPPAPPGRRRQTPVAAQILVDEMPRQF
ncbi:MAG: FkbM family methyltransferase [Pseudonocardiales bacterium]|nr:FkbM family methyltransferase [Pseudonocardiales bacterium]